MSDRPSGSRETDRSDSRDSGGPTSTRSTTAGSSSTTAGSTDTAGVGDGDGDEPMWLDDDEQRAWRSLIAALVRLPAELDRHLQAAAGISHMEYQVLAMLSEAEGRTMRMSVLAGQVESSLPRLSQVVGRLEARGWVERCTDPDDGRYTLATLTDPGWEALVAAAPLHVVEVRRLVIDPLSRTQVGQLDTITRRILAAIDEDR